VVPASNDENISPDRNGLGRSLRIAYHSESIKTASASKDIYMVNSKRRVKCGIREDFEEGDPILTYVLKATGLGFIFLSICLFGTCCRYQRLSSKYTEVKRATRKPVVIAPVEETDVIVRKEGSEAASKKSAKKRN